MRRLLASVACTAVAAAVLLVPAAASAALPPMLTAPGPTPVLTNVAPTPFTWTDVAIGGETITYRLYRAPGACAGAAGAVVSTVVSTALAPVLSTTDAPRPPDETYCYYVTAEDSQFESPPSNRVTVTLDTTAPVIAVTPSGGDGCTLPFTFTATVGDASAMFVDGTPYTAGTVFTPGGAPYASVTPTVTASDTAGNQAVAVAVPGRILDPSPPGPISLEVSTDPAAQKATLNWDPVVNDGAPVTYRVRTRGPQGPKTDDNLTPPFQPLPLQVDATYEFTLEAVDACGRLTSSVRLVRLNDAVPPSMPVVSGPMLTPAHAVALSWVASSDNIQVDHYVVLRDGVPLGVTDATSFTDVAPPQHAQLSYVVRAVDTNGNATDSAAAPITTPDWTPPNAPALTVTVQGTTATLRWTAATDNVGVVGYDVVRDGKGQASMTSAVRIYKDTGLTPGVHTWAVRSRDDADLTATSANQTAKVSKAVAIASVLSLRMAGGGRTGALRYSLKPRARLLVDLHVIGTVAKARLRLYVDSGRGRITVWRGTPGSSALRLRLGSAVARRGYVTVPLSRTLHTGRIRLVLIPGAHVVIAGKGSRRPAMRT